MVVQAAPKTHPGGVQGAFAKFVYQKDVGPSFINQLPKASPPKLMTKKRIRYFALDMFSCFEELLFSSTHYQLLGIFGHLHFY